MSSPQGEVNHGRLLMSEDPLTPPQPQPKWLLTTFVLGLFFRTFAILFIFLKLFVYGEPSLQPDSKIAAKYWAFKRRADLTLEKVPVLPSIQNNIQYDSISIKLGKRFGMT